MKRNIIVLTLLIICLSASSHLTAMENQEFGYQKRRQKINQKYAKNLIEAENENSSK